MSFLCFPRQYLLIFSTRRKIKARSKRAPIHAQGYSAPPLKKEGCRKKRPPLLNEPVGGRLIRVLY